MSEIIGNNEMVSVVITTNVKSFPTERRYASNITIGELKAKLELITGASNESMKLQLLDNNDEVITELDDNRRQLKSYLSDSQIQSKINLHVIDNTTSSAEFEDLSKVEKFELSEEEYQKRGDSVLAFKMKNKLGRFGQMEGEGDHEEQQITPDIKVSQRCEVSVKGFPKRRATVMFVGNTKFKPGIWVGVKYDEPLGKNDGSVDGIRYFDCKAKYGGFVRPIDVIVGNFPEIGFDSDEEMV